MRRTVLILNKADILATLACLLISTIVLALYPHSTGLAEEIVGPTLPKEDMGFKDKLKRWREMSPEQKEIIKERFRQWKDLPPEERGKLTHNFQTFKPLPPSPKFPNTPSLSPGDRFLNRLTLSFRICRSPGGMVLIF